jgi:hypothetical protein
MSGRRPSRHDSALDDELTDASTADLFVPALRADVQNDLGVRHRSLAAFAASVMSRWSRAAKRSMTGRISARIDASSAGVEIQGVELVFLAMMGLLAVVMTADSAHPLTPL